jgi:hypothetical protein
MWIPHFALAISGRPGFAVLAAAKGAWQDSMSFGAHSEFFTLFRHDAGGRP